MLNLIFISKIYDIINTDTNEKIGNVLMFENTNHDNMDGDVLIPDYIIVMVTTTGIEHITSEILDTNSIKQYLENTYKLNELLEL